MTHSHIMFMHPTKVTSPETGEDQDRSSEAFVSKGPTFFISSQRGVVSSAMSPASACPKDTNLFLKIYALYTA